MNECVGKGGKIKIWRLKRRINRATQKNNMFTGKRSRVKLSRSDGSIHFYCSFIIVNLIASFFPPTNTPLSPVSPPSPHNSCNIVYIKIYLMRYILKCKSYIIMLSFIGY